MASTIIIDGATSPRTGYRIYVLALLTTVYFLYMLDRSAILITQELIKGEFGLSDTQMGLLIGTIYGVSYAIAGLPIGWLVDRLNRRNLLILILSVWSALTAMCGVSSAYWHLVAARIGVGAAESGGAPASLSILSDLYSPERRATVTSIFYSGTSIGMVASYFVGGLVAREFGWRAVFLLYGLPGLLVALIIFVTMREPLRHRPALTGGPRTGVLRSALQVLATPHARLVYLGAVLYCTSTAAFGGWLVAFLMRIHHVDVATAGMIIASALGVCGIFGTIAIGWLADRMRGLGGPMLVVGGAAFVNVSAATVALNGTDLPVVIAALAVFGATMTAYSGPTTAVLSRIVAPVGRGMAFALFQLLANLVGGMGPLIVGMVSDRLEAGHLGSAMQTLVLVNIIGGICCLQVGRALNASDRAAAA